MTFDKVWACTVVKRNNEFFLVVEVPITMRCAIASFLVNRLEDYGAVIEKVQLVIVLSSTPVCEAYVGVGISHDELSELRTLRRNGA